MDFGVSNLVFCWQVHFVLDFVWYMLWYVKLQISQKLKNNLLKALLIGLIKIQLVRILYATFNKKMVAMNHNVKSSTFLNLKLISPQVFSKVVINLNTNQANLILQKIENMKK